MKAQKKAQSMSINTIIVALLALLVMVLLIAILTGRIKIFNTATSDCASTGGICDPLNNGKCEDGYIVNVNAKPCSDTKPCCISISGR